MNERKYELRNKKKPYYIEKDINDRLKEFEVFDGEIVHWGIKGDTITIRNSKYSNATPFFENMVDRYEYDKDRILYLDDDKCVFRGKIKNNEVLGKIDSVYKYNSNFVTFYEFGDDVRIREKDNDKAFVEFKKDGFSKCIHFDLKSFKPYGNIFDVISVDNHFLKSYQIGDRTRVFLGRVNPTNGVVKPIGYDVNNHKFISFPLDEDGLINEDVMMNDLQNENPSIGINSEVYKNLEKFNIICTLIDLKVDGFELISELDRRNPIKIKVK